VSRLGVEAITGKPHKPTTQGKNERFHQTLFRYLDKQPLAESLAELQTQVDAFDHLYNTERPHQGLPGRVTPLTAWEATPKADPPRPDTSRSWLDRPVVSRHRRPRPQPPADLPADTRVRKVSSAGVIHVDKVFYKIDVDHAFKQVLVVSHGHQAGDKIIVTDLEGEILAEHTRPTPGVTYVGNGRPPGTRPRHPEPSPKS
jgi:putative transposase